MTIEIKEIIRKKAHHILDEVFVNERIVNKESAAITDFRKQTAKRDSFGALQLQYNILLHMFVITDIILVRQNSKQEIDEKRLICF